jgi:hypothetical protein
MQRVYLTRRNLLALLSKLDRAAAGENTECTILKQDTLHPHYPSSDIIQVTRRGGLGILHRPGAGATVPSRRA